MGGQKVRNCNDIIKEILMWCIQRQLVLLIFYILGKLNIEVDRVSRELYNSNKEQFLDFIIFDEFKFKWGDFEIDMFLLRLNYKMFLYVVWKLDLCVEIIDIFILYWFRYKFIYCFIFFGFFSKVFQFI